MKIHVYNDFCKVLDITDEEEHLLEDSLSFQVPNAYWSPLYARGLWDGIKRFYSSKSKRFASGFLPYLLQIFEEARQEIVIIQDFRQVPQAHPFSVADWVRVLQTAGITPNPRLTILHVEVASLLIGTSLLGIPWPRGLISLPTGSGKTLLSLMLYKTFNVPTLYLESSRDRLLQMVDTCQRVYNKSPGILMSSQLQVKRLTCAMVQTVISQLKRGNVQLAEWLQKIQVLLVDEAHLVSNNSYLDIIKLCSNASVRVALSGSLFKREDMSNWYLMGAFGTVLKHVSSRELQGDSGTLASVRVFLFDISTPRYEGPYALAEQKCIIRNDYRNLLGIQAALRAQAYGWITLILVTKVEHGQRVQNLFAELGHKVPFLCYQDPAEERKQYLNLLRSGSTKLLIASKIFNTGIDVPQVRCIIRLGAGKSPVATVQIPGRGMRKKQVFNYLFLVDFNDRTQRHLANHSRKRIRVYQQEGYSCETVTDVEDIPYTFLEDSSAIRED